MLILASASPRRRDLLLQSGLTFEVDFADIPEAPLPEEDAATYVLRLAEAKAQAVWARRARTLRANAADDPLMVLGADTCVLSQGEILGKPADQADARARSDHQVGMVEQGAPAEADGQVGNHEHAHDAASNPEPCCSAKGLLAPGRPSKGGAIAKA